MQVVGGSKERGRAGWGIQTHAHTMEHRVGMQVCESKGSGAWQDEMCVRVRVLMKIAAMRLTEEGVCMSNGRIRAEMGIWVKAKIRG